MCFWWRKCHGLGWHHVSWTKHMVSMGTLELTNNSLPIKHWVHIAQWITCNESRLLTSNIPTFGICFNSKLCLDLIVGKLSVTWWWPKVSRGDVAQVGVSLRMLMVYSETPVPHYINILLISALVGKPAKHITMYTLVHPNTGFCLFRISPWYSRPNWKSSTHLNSYN